MPITLPTQPDTAGITRTPFTERMFDRLIDPHIPDEAGLSGLWALAGAPGAHLQFTTIPDKHTLQSVYGDMEMLHRVAVLPGCKQFLQYQELRLTNKLMLLKSVSFGGRPNLMEMMVDNTAMMRAREGQRKPTDHFYSQFVDMVSGAANTGYGGYKRW